MFSLVFVKENIIYLKYLVSYSPSIFLLLIMMGSFQAFQISLIFLVFTLFKPADLHAAMN